MFAEKIMILRKQRGMSQEQLADRLGVTRQSVSKWESASSVPELSKLILLSELFGVSIDYLVKDDLAEEDLGREKSGMGEVDTARLEEKMDSLLRYQKGYEYTSRIRIKGIPLVCIRLANRRIVVAKGIIAVGNVAVGIVSIGAASLGIISLGACSLGALAVGAIAVGIAAVGAVAVGVIAIGAAAIGVYAAGAAACGKELAVGAAAKGRVAVGKEVSGTHVLKWKEGMEKETIENFITVNCPGIGRFLAKLFSFFGID